MIDAHSLSELALAHRAVVVQQAEKLELFRLEAVGVVRSVRAAHRLLTEQCEQQASSLAALFERGPTAPAFTRKRTRMLPRTLTSGEETCTKRAASCAVLALACLCPIQQPAHILVPYDRAGYVRRVD